MELLQLWNVIRRRWWLILIPAVIGLIAAIPTLRQAVSPAPNYTVGVRFTAGQPPTGSAAGGTNNYQDQNYVPWLASEYTVNALAAWVRTDSFATEVASALKTADKTFDPNAIRAAIASDNSRSILTLSLTWNNEEEIKQLAQAASDVLKSKTQLYFNPELGSQKVIVTPLDGIIVAPVAPSLTTRLAPLPRVAIGLIAGLVLAFLAEYLDPTMHTRTEFESLRLPILAEIPRY